MAVNVMHDRVLGDERESDIEGGAGLPAAGTHLFQIFFNTTDSTLNVWDGSTWVTISGSTPPTTVGQMIGAGPMFGLTKST